MNAKIEKNELNKVHKIGTPKNSVKKMYCLTGNTITEVEK